MDNQSNYNNGNNGYGGGGYGSGGPGNNGSNGNNNNNGNNGDNNNKNNKNGQMIMVFILVSLVALFIMSMVMNRYTSMSTSEISYSDFLQMVEDGKVESVEFDSYQINITPVSENKNPYLQEQTYYCGRLDDPDLLPLLKDKGITISRVIPDNTSTWIYNILSFLLPLVLIWILMGVLMKRMGGGAMGVGKSTAKVYVEKTTGVTFKDVAGQDEAKESLQEVVDFLHNPKKYREIGAKLPKGAMLVGPPGTGKTLLAKAVAGEAGVPFFSLAGSDFVEMFVGVGASRVRSLFEDAKKAERAIIFIDEIDAVGRRRGTGMGGGNDEREQTLNQLLIEMDGFDGNENIIVIAATNRSDVLDPALLRPGRFDRRVIVERPDLKGRIETLKVHAKDVKMDETVDFEEIALATSGAVGSDLANMINEAALGAVKAGRKAVSQKDLFEAVEVVIAGKEKKDRILGDEEKHIVAYHEVGHALVMALQKESEPVQKITIVPRTMGALGYTMQRPEEEKYLNKKDEMLADLVSFFGGRAAEEVKFNSVTTGASNDIERATAIARAMVTQYGMSDEFGLIGLESITNRYLDGRAVMNCAETTAAKVDEVVMKMLKEAYAKAVTYIRENMDILDEAAEFLIQRETITGKEFMEIFNKYKNPVEESDKNVSETAENDAEISEAEVKTDSEIKTEEENTSTYNTGYAQWVEDDDDEE